MTLFSRFAIVTAVALTLGCAAPANALPPLSGASTLATNDDSAQIINVGWRHRRRHRRHHHHHHGYVDDYGYVDAPYTYVSPRGRVVVDAPYAYVYRSRGRIRVRAPYANVYIPR